MKVLVNKKGYLESPYITDASEEVEVTDEEWERLSTFPKFHNWRYRDGKWSLECIDEDNWLRLQRQRKCFDVIDGKSNLWYQMLTEEQSAELKKWYQDWLSVTDTKVQPETPKWIK